MDPLNFLHGSQVENPDLEEERYRKKSLLCFSPFLPFPRFVLNPFPPSPSLFPAVSISSLYLSFLTSSSHSLPSLHFLFSFSIIHFSVHSAHDHQEQALELVCSWQKDEVWAKREMHHGMLPKYEMDAACSRPGLFIISKRKTAASTAQKENGQLFAHFCQYTISKVIQSPKQNIYRYNFYHLNIKFFPYK